jgi:hypothetical protein
MKPFESVFFTLVFWVATFWLSDTAIIAQSELKSSASSRSETEADNDTREVEVTTVECDATIRAQRSGGAASFLYARVELPGLEAAKKYKLIIKLFNPTETAIRFSGISATCGCAKIESEDNEIASMGYGQVVMFLDVPNKLQSNRAQVGAKFISPTSPEASLTLVVSYDLLSAFGFDGDRVNIDLPKDEAVIVTKVPVRIVPPLTVKDLELKLTENLQDINAKLVTDDPDINVPYIELTVAGRNISRSGILGELILSRIGTKQVAGVMVNLRHERPFTLRPESIRLTPGSSKDSFHATAMLRVSRKRHDIDPSGEKQKGANQLNETEVSHEPLPPHVELTIGGQTARVKLHRLGETGIYRMTISLDGPLDVKSIEPLEVRWAVLLDGETEVIESHAFLSSFSQ